MKTMFSRHLSFLLCFLLISSIALSGCNRDSPETSKEAEETTITTVTTINISQSITERVSGAIFTYDVFFHAEKIGGKEIDGNYSGKSYAQINMDTSGMSGAALGFSGGIDVFFICDTFSFDLEEYDFDTFSKFYEENASDDELAPLAPLALEYIANISAPSRASATLDMLAEAVMGGEAEVNESDAEKGSMAMLLTVSGQKASINIPSLGIGDTFTGKITTMDMTSDRYTDDMNDAKKSMESASAAFESIENTDLTGDAQETSSLVVAGIDLGELGENLSLPEGFDTTLFSLPEDANIFNAGSSKPDEKKAYHIMFYTSLSASELKEFYNDIVEAADPKMSDDTMFMADYGGHRITISITEDTMTGQRIVYLDYKEY